MSGIVNLTESGKAPVVYFDKEKKPRVGWTQTEDQLAIIVRVPGATEVDVDVKSRSFGVQLTGEDGKRYKAGFALTGKVATGEESWNLTTRLRSVKIQLAKDEVSKGEWEKLVDLPARDTKNWLEYDWDAHNEIEPDDVEPDEKEVADVEPRKKRRPDEDVAKPKETAEQKKSRWTNKQAQLKEEAAAYASTQKNRQAAPLQFTCTQLATLLSIVVAMTAIFTHFVTKRVMLA